jgi:hypothetical protein
VIKWLEDRILAFIQKRCKHPDEMVAVDILEGMWDGFHVTYCRRCGAVRVESDGRGADHLPWRSPDPHLWRGYHTDAFNEVMRSR